MPRELRARIEDRRSWLICTIINVVLSLFVGLLQFLVIGRKLLRSQSPNVYHPAT
jgi:hypothetical protein